MLHPPPHRHVHHNADNTGVRVISVERDPIKTNREMFG